MSLAYNGDNRLSKVQAPGRPLWEAYYSPQGQRLLIDDRIRSQYYFYNGDNLYAEYGNEDPRSRPDARYIQTGLDAPIAGFSDSDNLFYHTDGLGSIGLTTDRNGKAQTRSRYDSFGQAINLSGGSPYRFGYSGREADATGLMYYRNRYYVPGAGRFTQPDPAGFADGPNLFGYVGNNPMSFIDPMGLSAKNPILPGGQCHCSYADTSSFGGVSDEPSDPLYDIESYQQPYSAIDEFQGLLGWAGVAPGVGIVPDILNTGISVVRGNWGDAGFNLVAAIPILGDAARVEKNVSSIVAKGSDITPEIIQNALKGDTVYASQKAVELERVQKYYDMLSTSSAPSIKMDGNVITDGHHTYIAGKIKGILPTIVPGIMTTAKEFYKMPISEIKTY